MGPAGAGYTKSEPGEGSARGLAFEAVSGDEERPWADLLFVGTFSRETLNKLPCSFNVSDGWMDVLRESGTGARSHLAARFAFGGWGTGKGAFAKACEHFRSSLALKDNAAAHRCLAAYRSYAGDLEASRQTTCGPGRSAETIRTWRSKSASSWFASRIITPSMRLQILAGSSRRPRTDHVVEGAGRAGTR